MTEGCQRSFSLIEMAAYYNFNTIRIQLQKDGPRKAKGGGGSNTINETFVSEKQLQPYQYAPRKPIDPAASQTMSNFSETL